MKKFILLILIAISLCGCNPRVMKCGSCGNTYGVRGALLPGQGTKCECGGTYHVIKELTNKEWQEAQERGYVEE